MKCVVITHFSKQQPGFLDFSYRIKALGKRYPLTIVSNMPLPHVELQVDGAEYIVLPEGKGRLGWLRFLWDCGHLIRARRPDHVVLLHSAAAPVARLTGAIPTALYWNEHPTNLNRLADGFAPIANTLSRLAQWLVFSGARHANLVMPIGEEHRDDLLAKGVPPAQMEMIYMGVADQFGECMGRQDDAETEPLELIYIGTVSKLRGRDVMLDAMKIVANAGIPVRLTIVGAGDDQLNYCQENIARLGLEKHVRVLGRVSGNEMPSFLGRADVGICLWEDKPWWRFNPPTKLFEYLAAGLPVLASDIRTHTRYIEDWGNGFIFKYGPDDLARVIIAIVDRRRDIPAIKKNAHRSGREYLWSRIEPVFLGAVEKVARG
jgi:glycosyltransferase involved in cell wall biosynthesis